MSSKYNYGYGVTQDDRRELGEMHADAQTHAQQSQHTPDYQRPELPVKDGERHVVELRGASKTRKVHRDDPDSEGASPWCGPRKVGFKPGSSHHEFRYRGLGMARVWREPCAVCFPGGFPE